MPMREIDGTTKEDMLEGAKSMMRQMLFDEPVRAKWAEADFHLANGEMIRVEMTRMKSPLGKVKKRGWWQR